MKRLLCVILFFVMSLSLFAQVEVKKEGEKFILLVDKKPYYIKGVTYGIGADPEKIDGYMEDIKFLGANTIRTWGCGEKDTPILLDAAQRHGIKVMLGLWLRHGRSGMEGDDNFNYAIDAEGKKAQYEDTLKWVAKFKDHPALLMWGVGNEVILNIGPEDQKIAYAQFLETLVKGIKAIDKKHPVASVSAWSIAWPYWTKYTPSLDVYAVNAYGAGMNVVENEWKQKCPPTKPYMVTEFGASGEWDAKPDGNGLKVEPDDKEKYETIANGWKNWVETKPMCLGGFVFNYGDGWDHGAVWLSFKMRSMLRPSYWGTRKAFTGLDPVNSMPIIDVFSFPVDQSKPDKWVKVKLNATDVDSKDLTIKFYYNKREGSRKKRDAIFLLESKGDMKKGYQVKVPQENGVVKMYAFVSDEQKNLSISQTSFIVNAGLNKGTMAIRGMKAELPFYVYDEDGPGITLPYVASGWMGDKLAVMKMDNTWKENPARGKTCIKFTFDADAGWGGIAWQDPPNDWGKEAGGYDLTGAKVLRFKARGDVGGEQVDFGYGLIDKKEPYYDTAKDSKKGIVLTKEWQQFEFSLKDKDLTCIKTPFVFFFGVNGKKLIFYLDDIVYE